MNAASHALLLALAVTAVVAVGGCATAEPRVDRGSSPPVTTVHAAPAFGPAIDSARAAIGEAARHGAGVAVAIYERGEPVWLEGVGYAEPSSRTPVDPVRTRFRIYSVAKPMTAVAGARLMERRALDPSAPIQRYVPVFPEKSSPVTAMQLATHRSGIRHYASEAEARSLRHCPTVESALDIFADDPLVHEPGAAETYSSWGFVLLSAVVAGAADAPFMEAMRRLVFDPAGMASIALDDPTGEVAARATAYEETGGTLRLADAVDNTCKWGAGGFVGTAQDVARFGTAMLDGTLISPRSLELFLRGGDAYRAQGVGAGGTAFLLIDAGRELSIAVASNVSGEMVGPALRAAVARIHRLFGSEVVRSGSGPR